MKASKPLWQGACEFHGDCVEGLASGAAIAARILMGGGVVEGRPELLALALAADTI